MNNLQDTTALEAVLSSYEDATILAMSLSKPTVLEIPSTKVTHGFDDTGREVIVIVGSDDRGILLYPAASQAD